MKMEIWEKYGLEKKEWDKLSVDDRAKITGMSWKTAKCSTCGIKTMVAGKPKKVLCMECS